MCLCTECFNLRLTLPTIKKIPTVRLMRAICKMVLADKALALCI